VLGFKKEIKGHPEIPGKQKDDTKKSRK
jgi:hypothetical protein